MISSSRTRARPSSANASLPAVQSEPTLRKDSKGKKFNWRNQLSILFKNKAKVALVLLTLISLASLISKGRTKRSSSTHRSIRSNGNNNKNKKEDAKKKKGKEEEKKKKPKEEDKELRPSGVSYKYIAPPKINWKARKNLTKQIPHLADLSEKKAKDSTALCAFVHQVDTDLDEWVDYHTGLGFHTIYLVDNTEEHDLLSWQNKRRNAGYSVSVMPKPGGKGRQKYGYHMCASEHKNDHKFMAFWDVDEFLVLKKHATIDEMLKKHLKDGSLTINQYIFGTGSTDNYGPMPVTKRFMNRDGDTKKDQHEEGKSVRSILTLSDYSGFPESVHSFKTKKGTWKDTNGKGKYDKNGATNLDRPVDVAVLHHYKYRSPQEFYSKACEGEMKGSPECRKKNKPYAGTVKDDSAWEAMKKNVPRYAMFDEFEDFM